MKRPVERVFEETLRDLEREAGLPSTHWDSIYGEYAFAKPAPHNHYATDPLILLLWPLEIIREVLRTLKIVWHLLLFR